MRMVQRIPRRSGAGARAPLHRVAIATLASPRPALQPRDEFGQLGGHIDRPRAESMEQLEYAVAIFVAHQDDDPRRVRSSATRAGSRRTVELGLQRLRLGGVDRDFRRVPTAGHDPGHQLADDRLGGPAAQVPEGLLDRDPLGALGGDPADATERVVGPVAGGPDDRGDRRRPTGRARRDALGDVEDGGHARLVVGEVDDDDPVAEAVQVEPARRPFGIGREVRQPVAHLGDRRAEPSCATGRGEGVGHVVAGQAADGDRHVGDVDDRGLVRAIGLDQRAIAHQVRAPATLAVASDRGGRVAVEGEQRDPGPNATRDRGDQDVVGVEHDPAVRPRDPADRRLDLGQLGQGVDALQVEMVGGDVRQHAGVVGLVAHAAQHDPAARRLEHRDLDVAPAPGSGARRPAPSSRPGRPSARRRAPRRRSSSRRAGPARSRMWVISRVTVLLPLVPETDTIGTVRSRSRTHSGGVARAAAMRSAQRVTWRSWAPVRWACRDDDTSRSARASAASVRVSARSAPTHGKVTIQCPGSDERWTATPPGPPRARHAASRDSNRSK